MIGYQRCWSRGTDIVCSRPQPCLAIVMSTRQRHPYTSHAMESLSDFSRDSEVRPLVPSHCTYFEHYP
jgi:hypothetical protein